MLNRFWYCFSFCFLLLLCPDKAFSQEIGLKGRFSVDTIKVGEPIFYSFSVRYPRQMMVLLPDSTFNFAPFEFVDKTYYPTRTDSLYSTDSVVYTLSTFELDLIQQLRLPAYVVQGRDSSTLFAEPDTVWIQELIPVVTDSAAFVETTSYVEVPKEFNYPYIILGILLSLGILVALVFVFNKPFRRQYKIYKLKRQYRKYEKEFKEGLEAYKAKQEHMRPEKLLGIWKAYMEQLEKTPYTKLTTKEIAMFRSNGTDLKSILRPIDRGIYGRFIDAQMVDSFRDLHRVATESFESKVKEVQHD